MYPIKFYPIYKEKIWGGVNLQTQFDRQIPNNLTGESWELCCHGSDTSIVSNGIYRNKSIRELIDLDSNKIMGKTYLPSDRFPLLLKIIDANDNLSVQVHPNNAYAMQNEGDLGKTEAWYILDARENARIIYGLKENITREVMERSIYDGCTNNMLRYVTVEKGDIVYIPAGTVHAILSGVMLYEVQQNSDVTYRIYDYDRADKNGLKRELHIAKALDVIDFGKQQPTEFKNNEVQCDYFSMKKLFINGATECKTDNRFIVYYIVEGSGKIIYENGSETITKGETVLIPACLTHFTLSGAFELIEITN